MTFSGEATKGVEQLTLVTEPSEAVLNERERLDYRHQREACLQWLLTWGKIPDQAEGYAYATVENLGARMDRFYRWVWEHDGGYTANVEHSHADGWMDHLAQRACSNAHKNCCLRAARMLMKWRHHEHGLEQWEPRFTFKRERTSVQPRDFLTEKERTWIREAALSYGSVPSFEGLTPNERERWKRYLAQARQKPKASVTREDWEKENSWKIPSLVWTSLDAGLRPIEVERAVTGWVDVENAMLRIPAMNSSKNVDNWKVSLQSRTAEILRHWLEERQAREQYDMTDALWLTRESNPYQTSSLRYLLHKLCEAADISVENRQMSWYTIRHSLGTYMTREEDLKAAQSQLRHASPETTMKYDQAPVKDRRDALTRMG